MAQGYQRLYMRLGYTRASHTTPLSIGEGLGVRLYFLTNVYASLSVYNHL